jgi:apolipoprotein N-acyltransferase
MMTTPLGTSAAQGANLLISVANDAWYGDSAALLLHETLGQWRAVENRRYFLRATNSGLTSAIDPLGRRFFELPRGQSAAGTLTARLLTASTLYQRHPDRFTQFVLGLGLVLLGWSRATKFRGPEDAPD